MIKRAQDKTSSGKLVFSILLLIIGMAMLTLASVPIYNLFCKVTGYGGTVKYTGIASGKIGSKLMKVRFDANVDRNLPWKFKAEQKEVTIQVGENNLVFYTAENKTDQDIIGTAVYNVAPHSAGIYFNKIQCFCFQEQLLKSNQKMIMPVSFYIDPAIEDDPNLQDVDTITLSYTFYKVIKEE